MRIIHCLLIALLATSAARAADQPGTTSPARVPWRPAPNDNGSKVIYGDDDRVDYYTIADPQKKQWADSTCALVDIADLSLNLDGTYALQTYAYRFSNLPACPEEPFGDQPTSPFCTGFMVGPDAIATAGHCCQSYSLNDMYFVFGFVMTNETTPVTTFTPDQVYQGINVLGHQFFGEYDYTIVQTDRPIVAPNAVPFDIRRDGVVPIDQKVGVIGYPWGLPLKLAFGDGTYVRSTDATGYFTCNTDTYKGNSGSPIINQTTGLVEGILVRGDTDLKKNGACFVSRVNTDDSGGEDASKTTTFMQFIPPLMTKTAKVNFNRTAYPAESEARITLLDSDLIGTGAQTVSSTATSGDQETVTVTETATTGRFAATIPIHAGAAIPGNGILEVRDTDVITVSYADAATEEGIPATATGDANIDTTPPQIANIVIESIGVNDAEIHCATNETCTVRVLYGTSCETPNRVIGSPSGLTHDVLANGLAPNAAYAFSIVATDTAGNVTQEDNAGACYTFVTAATEDFNTQLFQGGLNAFNLQHNTITFVPLQGSYNYSTCKTPADAFPESTEGAAPLSLGDDATAQVLFPEGKQFLFKGNRYASLFIGSNGYLTFGQGDTSNTILLDNYFSMPRIAALYCDLNPELGGAITGKALENSFVVTFQNILEYTDKQSTEGNSFQIELFYSGVIRITWLNITPEVTIAGLSAGNGIPENFASSDFSAYPACDVQDTDEDGLGDAPELLTYGANPERADSDRDGVNDGDEVAAGTSPTGEGEPHDADTNGDFRISLQEAMQIAQWFNTNEGAYSCTLDGGYQPGPGATECRQHHADYEVPAYRITLSEITRIGQLFAAGTYHRDMFSEDSFAPGPN